MLYDKNGSFQSSSTNWRTAMIVAKTIVLNFFIVSVIFCLVVLVRTLDGLFGLPDLSSIALKIIGWLIIAIELFFRFWASYAFYKYHLAVLVPNAQHQLVTEGPYQWTRNPLYVGIVLITFGLALVFGSLVGIIFSTINFAFWHLWICFHEEKNLEQIFGKEYQLYKKSRPRWLLF